MRNATSWFGGAAVAALVVVVSPVTAQVVEGDRSSAPAAPRQATSFWNALDDATLEQLIEIALEGNWDVEAADARVERSEAARRHSAFGLAPIVTANAGYTRQRFSNYAFPGAGGAGAFPDQDVWDARLVAAWEVDAFGRQRGELGARRAEEQATREGARDARVAVTAAVAETYFGLRGLQERLAVARRNAENQRRTLDLTETRLSAGRGTELDAERARAQLSFTLAAIPALEAEVGATRDALSVLVGREPVELEGELLAERATPELPDAIPLAEGSSVVGRRPDVVSAEQRVAASRSLASSARADYLPRLSIVAGAGYTAGAVDAFGRQGTFNYSVGPVLSWAAFDLGRVKARADEARAGEVEARAQYERTVLAAQQEIGAASARYRAARARLASLEQAAQSSERAATLARVRYEGGMADFLQVLDAERTLLAAQDQLAQARTGAAEAYVALYAARGGVWTQ